MRKNKNKLRWALAGAVALAAVQRSDAGWVAYNDSAYKAGQENAPNVTTFGLGRNFEGEGSFGNLLNFWSGEFTPATVNFQEQISTGSINSAGDAASYAPGSDAEGIFGGRVDISGNMSYGDSPGWHLDTIFEGLDPAKKYTFAGMVDRNGGEGYRARVTNWRVLGADSAVNASSHGVHLVPDGSVEFSTGHNPEGYVARWVDIRPGADGTFVIRTSHTVGEANGGLPGASAFQGYAGGAFMLVEQEENWEAYNDSAYKSTQIIGENVTTYGVGRNFEGQGSGGPLISQLTGADTTVSVQFEEFFSTGSINSAGDTAEFVPGTDAEALFAGKVDLSGNMSYGDSPGWYLDLIITGLDPTRLYTFAGTANRNGGEGYLARVTNWRIMGAENFTYASSSGAHRVSDDSVEFSTGHNPDGLVARWSNIQPGSDGKIVIRTTHSVGEANGGIPGASAFQGYAGGLFMVRAQPPGEYRWAAFNDSSYKAGQINSPFVTTYGVGRNFESEASGGPLRDLLSGQWTEVQAQFEEEFSTGSINSAGDAAPFPAGSDAEAFFSGIADLSGNMSYGDSPGWHLDLIFTGLDPQRAYTFVGTAHRNGGEGYAARVTNWRVMGADSAVYASSSGAHRVSEDSVEFSTGHNPDGLVARWVDIRPGDDGTFVIRTSHSVGEANGGIPGASAFQGYAGGLFMLAEQVSEGGGGDAPIQITSIFPGENGRNIHPNAPIVVTVQHNSAGVDPESVSLLLNGEEVEAEISTDEGVTTIRHQPAASFESASTQTVAVSLADDSEEPTTVSRSWSFEVMDYWQAGAIPASYAVSYDPSVHRTRGFAVRVAAADPLEYDILDMGWAEAIWDMEFTNLADPSIFNELGYFIETTDINYHIDQATRGSRANERRFPGIAGSGQPGEQFVYEARGLLHLQPGYYRMNVTMTTEFKLVVGEGINEMELPKWFTPCTNCGGDDGPWVVEFTVEEEGLYPFRLVFFSRAGAASLEWLEVTPSGSRLLIDEKVPGAIVSYVPPEALTDEPVGDVTLVVSRDGDSLSISWEGTGVLESAPAVDGPWTAVTGAANPHEVTVEAGDRFYRLRL